ncbi:MAG: alpha/beta hydrolase [Nocardioides sp.]
MAIDSGRELDPPSRRHQLLAYALPLVLRSTELEDEGTERERVMAVQDGRSLALPTVAVPGLSRRFSVDEERLVGPHGVEFSSFVLTPRAAGSSGPGRTLFYLHGGAFVAPIDPVHVRYATRLATALGARVVLPQYPLTPRRTWQDSVQPLIESVAEWAAKSPGGLILGGDSSGGGLALAVAIGVRDQLLPGPRRLLLHAPWADLTTSTPETATVYAKKDTWLKYSKALAYARWWAGSEEDLGRPEVSPALADLDGLPPGLMIAGTRDLLLPGCRLLADRAAASSWDLTYLERPDLVHVFGIMPLIPEARRAFRYAVSYLDRGLPPPR